jgi:hypothetical protein
MRCLSCDETQPGGTSLYRSLLARPGTVPCWEEAVAACQSVASTGRAQYVIITPARQRAVAGNSSP